MSGRGCWRWWSHPGEACPGRFPGPFVGGELRTGLRAQGGCGGPNVNAGRPCSLLRVCSVVHNPRVFHRNSVNSARCSAGSYRAPHDEPAHRRTQAPRDPSSPRDRPSADGGPAAGGGRPAGHRALGVHGVPAGPGRRRPARRCRRGSVGGRDGRTGRRWCCQGRIAGARARGR